MTKLIIALSLLCVCRSVIAFAGTGERILECKGVVDVCLNANITSVDKRTGATLHGYQPGEHKGEGNALWMDCVAKMAEGEPVEGVSSPVSQSSAKLCFEAWRAKTNH